VSVSSFFGKLFSSKAKHNLPIIDVDKRFEILGRTGQGSMSKVFRARDKNLGRTICLKLLDKEKTAKFEARFPGMNRPMEGFISSSMRHKNIVQTFEYGLTRKGEQYLVMELIEGMGLNFLIETKSKDLIRKRVDFLIQIADALDYVHQQKYLHRDICPRNVMVTKEGQVKLIDFGLTLPYLPVFCKPGNRTGTPNYLAPELIKRITTDHRVDLFALGVTAYETFTGMLPWEKTQSLATLQSHLNSPGKDPREFKPDLNPVLAELLIKSIEREPARRYQSAVAFREALKALPPLD
jgi:eukaryotic-like serine/threonine-protein kinase